ncbi:hypothetical protein E3N88_10538 [Mikania micrantha]|uniref:Terpene synthase metal-binding domain-containing protein n=1 Tax=Mikania micrantha TaxID=192012 RepID=A0A5N6PD59_9ASTR|nr:hypothetical protein E3N88_10538 [Mikania micrantha]
MITEDVQGMLELYEATYMRVQGEAILDNALAFTKTRLSNIANDPLCDDSLSKQIKEALERPIRKRLPRLDALCYIPIYQQDVSHNKSLLRLAKLGFNLLQSQHKKELSQLAKWWKGFDVPNNLPFTRDRSVENYFWILGVYFEPQYSRARVFLTKVIGISTILDDTYDAYGTHEELVIFTEAVQRWSITCMDELPNYMKLIYKGLLDIYEEMEETMAKEGKAHHVNYAKEAMKEMIRNFMTEAKWRNEGYIPTVEEHQSVSFMSCGYKMLTIAVEAYMKQHDVKEEEFVYDVFNQQVEEAWKAMNQESLKCKDLVSTPRDVSNASWTPSDPTVLDVPCDPAITKKPLVLPQEGASCDWTPASGSADTTGLETSYANAPFAPSWNILIKDRFENPAVALKLAKEFATPGQRLANGALSDEEMKGRMAALWAQLGALLSEINQRWTSASAVQDKNRTKMSILNNKLSQLQRGFQSMEEEKIHAL